jgi:glycosyltransferase involved in cell wall biosynthesis
MFVLASYHEGYGMALAEALARGLPVVATTAGAIPETVPDDAGLLVPPGDPQALAAALRRVMTEPALRAELMAGARAAHRRLPGWDDAAGTFAAELADLTRSAT